VSNTEADPAESLCRERPGEGVTVLTPRDVPLEAGPLFTFGHGTHREFAHSG